VKYKRKKVEDIMGLAMYAYDDWLGKHNEYYEANRQIENIKGYL
jgi:hypothetical protein